MILASLLPWFGRKNILDRIVPRDCGSPQEGRSTLHPHFYTLLLQVRALLPTSGQKNLNCRHRDELRLIGPELIRLARVPMCGENDSLGIAFAYPLQGH